MEVKDYSQRLEQARDKFRQIQDDLRTSYKKENENIKENLETKIAKQADNYDEQKSKLEEQNLINNQLFSEKTKATIADRQNKFKSEIQKNSEKFDQDRKSMKSEFSDKLANLSNSYKKSTEENNFCNSLIREVC